MTKKSDVSLVNDDLMGNLSDACVAFTSAYAVAVATASAEPSDGPRVIDMPPELKSALTNMVIAVGELVLQSEMTKNILNAIQTEANA